METGHVARLAVVVLVLGAAGCASAPPPPPAAPIVAETRTTGAVMLGAPVTMPDGPRTTIPSDTAR